MPNRKELLGLVMHDLVWDAVPQSWPFVSVESDGFYWASNTVTTNDQIAWGHGMGFSGGLQQFYTKWNYTGYVWPVRGGPVPEPGADGLALAAGCALALLRRLRGAV